MNPIELKSPLIEYRRLSDLRLNERNTRTHSQEQIEELAHGIDEFGWTVPVLADDEGVVAGHCRIAAAGSLYALGKRIKLPDGTVIPEWHVPVIDCTGWPEDKRRAYVIFDNKSAMNAGWNADLLRDELEWLRDEGFDMALTGFSPDELDMIFEPLVQDNQRDPDAVPDVPEVPHSQPGDVWVMGPHRIICGDSTLKETWDALLGTELGDCVMTDPPFGVSYKAKGHKAIANDELTGDKLREFLTLVNKHLFARVKPGSSVYVFHADSEGLAFRRALLDAGFKMSQCLTWVKDSLVLGRSRYQWRHEPVLLADRPGGKQRWWGGRKQTTVLEMGEGSPFQQQEDGRWAIRIGDDTLIVDGEAKVEQAPGSILRHPKPSRSAHHPTQKPVRLLQVLIKNSARANDLIIEPFSGSGSTLMAAETLGMCARAAELDGGYVDVAVMRWQAYTGRAAVHAGTGQPFPVPPDKCVAF